MELIVPNCEEGFDVLRDCIHKTFWPALFEGSVDERLFSLPTRLGGLGLRDPLESPMSLLVGEFHI